MQASRIVTGGETIPHIDDADEGATDVENRTGSDESGEEIEVPVYSRRLPARPEDWTRGDVSEIDGDEISMSRAAVKDGGATPEAEHGDCGTSKSASGGSTPRTETGQERAGSERFEPAAVARSVDRPERISCWLCRQPLASEESVRWRGEPVHPGCLRE